MITSGKADVRLASRISCWRPLDVRRTSKLSECFPHGASWLSVSVVKWLSQMRSNRNHRLFAIPWMLFLAFPLFVACGNRTGEKPEGAPEPQPEASPPPIVTKKGPQVPTETASSDNSQTWILVAEGISREEDPAPALIRALWAESPDPARWISALARALRDLQSGLSIRDSRTQASAALRRSLAKSFDENHEAHRSYAIAHAKTIGLALLGVEELQSRAKAEKWLPVERGQVDLLVADAAIDEQRFDVAFSATQRATETLKAASDKRLLNRAERILVVLLMRKGEWDKSFELSAQALAKASRSLAMSPYGIAYSDDPYERALEEIGQVARWASVLTPEWIRALAVIAATTKDGELKKKILFRLKSSMKLLTPAEYGEDDADVVTRQLRERGFDTMARKLEEMRTRP